MMAQQKAGIKFLEAPHIDMKNTAPVFLAIATVLFSGCASKQLRSDAATAAATGAPVPLESKIEKGSALTQDEIIALSKSGVSDDVILRNFEASWAVYDLKAGDVARLKSAGVSTLVIDAMLASHKSYGARSYRGGGHYYSPGHYGHYYPRHTFRGFRGLRGHRGHRGHHSYFRY